MRIPRLFPARHEPEAPAPAAQIAAQIETPALPPGLTDADRAALARAKARIPRKWRAVEKMLVDYAGHESVLRGRRT